jgi:hypothetical protein
MPNVLLSRGAFSAAGFSSGLDFLGQALAWSHVLFEVIQD